MAEKITPYFWVRVVVMGGVLVAVLWTMLRLNGRDNQLQSSHGENEIKLNICPTRVSSISVIGRMAVFQEGMTWHRTLEGRREVLDQVATEKWFSKYCQLNAKRAPRPASPAKPLMTLAYVAGLPVTIFRAEDGTFSWDQNYFKSDGMDQALSELESISGRGE